MNAPLTADPKCDHRGFGAVTLRMQREMQGNPDPCPWCEVEHLRSLAKFGALVLDEHRGDLGDVDGGWLQEKAVECGLLERVEVTAENMCRKASDMGQIEEDIPYCVCEIGDDCYRRTEASRAMDHE